LSRLLIVNADDFGLTPGVSAGILDAHRHGIVTSTSVLAVAPAFDQTAPALHGARESGIGVGVHLAAVGEDPPLLPRSNVASLVDEDGAFPLTWKAFLLRAARIRPAELEAELATQIDRVRSAGLTVDHLDAHQHLHLLPKVRAVVVKLARRFAIPAIRVPRAGSRRLAGIGVRLLARGLARDARRSGLVHPDTCEGFDDSGGMTAERLQRTVERIAASGAVSAEILVHPGAAADPARERYRWGYDWAGELAALVDPRAREAVQRGGFRLGTFRDLG
jgi:predicted glycoside hydrolase/deacetylase ChbG (UPF0249 family)